MLYGFVAANKDVVTVMSSNSQVDQLKAKLCKFRSIIVEEILVNIIFMFKYQEEGSEFLTDVLLLEVSLLINLTCTQIHLGRIGDRDMEESVIEMIVVNCQMSYKKGVIGSLMTSKTQIAHWLI